MAGGDTGCTPAGRNTRLSGPAGAPIADGVHVCSLRKGRQTTKEEAQLGPGRCVEKAGFALPDWCERPWLECLLLVLFLILSPCSYPLFVPFVILDPPALGPSPRCAGPGSALTLRPLPGLPRAGAAQRAHQELTAPGTRTLPPTPEGAPGAQTSRIPSGSLCGPGCRAPIPSKRQKDGGLNQPFFPPLFLRECDFFLTHNFRHNENSVKTSFS